MYRVHWMRVEDVISRYRTRLVLRVSAVSLVGLMVRTYGLLRFQRISDMKRYRISREGLRSCVERQIFGLFWIRVSGYYSSNIECWNWLRSRGLESYLYR